MRWLAYIVQPTYHCMYESQIAQQSAYTAIRWVSHCMKWIKSIVGDLMNEDFEQLILIGPERRRWRGRIQYEAIVEVNTSHDCCFRRPVTSTLCLFEYDSQHYRREETIAWLIANAQLSLR